MSATPSAAWLRQEEADWLVGDWTVAEAFRARYSPKPARKIKSASDYGRIVLRGLGIIRSADRVDWALAKAGWNLLPPNRLIQKWDEWVAYWLATQQRSSRLGSPYTCDPSAAIRAFCLGIKAEQYPKALASMLPERPIWPGNRTRVRAILRLSRKLRAREPMPLPHDTKTVWLKRLSRMSGAFLRAVWDELVCPNDESLWARLERLHAEWVRLQPIRPQLEQALVPARKWLKWFRWVDPDDKLMTAIVNGDVKVAYDKGKIRLRIGVEEVRTIKQCGLHPKWWSQSGLVWTLDAGPVSLEKICHEAAEAYASPRSWVAWAVNSPRTHTAAIKTVKDLVAFMAETMNAQRTRRDRLESGAFRSDPLLGARSSRARRAKLVRAQRGHLIRSLRPQIHKAWYSLLTSMDVREREIRAARPKEDPEDGSLVGWRVWNLVDDILLSPQQGTAWERPVMVAHHFPESARVRNVGGLHAEWGINCLSDHARVIGEVRGYGRTESGPEGWRSEEMVVVRLFVVTRPWDDSAHQGELEDRYGVPVTIFDDAYERRAHLNDEMMPKRLEGLTPSLGELLCISR
jgi:hypothetical protein